MRMSHRATTVSLSLEEAEMWQAILSRLRRMDLQGNNSTPFRTGIRLLAAMDDAALKAAIRETPSIQRGPKPAGEGEGRGAKRPK